MRIGNFSITVDKKQQKQPWLTFLLVDLETQKLSQHNHATLSESIQHPQEASKEHFSGAQLLVSALHSDLLSLESVCQWKEL